MSERRILVTGSRDWTDIDLVIQALLDAGPGRVIHGAARGLDIIAAQAAEDEGWPKPEAHRPDWDRYGKASGPIRNQKMADLGADVCLAFPLPGSKGTFDCAARAERAGIPIHWFPGPGLDDIAVKALLQVAREKIARFG